MSLLRICTLPRVLINAIAMATLQSPDVTISTILDFHEDLGHYHGLEETTARHYRNFIMTTMITTIISPFSALTPFVGWQEGHQACKSRVSVCWWGQFDWRIARLAPLVNATYIITAPIKYRTGHSDIRLSWSSQKMAVKQAYYYYYLVPKAYPIPRVRKQENKIRK